jgi:AcrR family transcriptional regulator
VADDDEDFWPPFHLSGRTGQTAQEQRIQHRMQGLRDHGKRPPGRTRSLSRDEIVRTAVAVADAEGPHSISMRRIARELDAGTMSLYWYVSSKEELLDLMLDAIHGELTATGITGDLRADLRAMAVTQRTMLRRHRWVMPFMAGRPPMGPKSLRNIERSLGFFAAAGITGPTAMTALMSVVTYVLGVAGREQQEDRSQQDEKRAQDRLELSEDEIREVYWEFLQRVMASGRYPNFTEMIKQGVDPDAIETQDERFEFGLDCLLDGIMARLGAEPGPDLGSGSGPGAGKPTG